MELSRKSFIKLVHAAYPEVAEKPILTEDQQMLLWRILRVIDAQPNLVTDKTVTHNISRAKQHWLKRLKEGMERS